MSGINWMDWCQKQLGDLSVRLFQQGYTQDRIEYLNQVEPEFREMFTDFMNQVDDIMNSMAMKPDSFSYFDAFTKAKKEFLEFTNWKRAQFLDLELAETA